MAIEMNRRQALLLGATSLASLSLRTTANDKTAAMTVPDAWINAQDSRVQSLLSRQVLDPASKWLGGLPDHFGLHDPRPAAALLYECAGAYYHPASKWHCSSEVLARMELAARFLERAQTDDGNIDLITTNFNSPPDTGFVVHRVATAARLAQKHDDDTIFDLLRPFLEHAGDGMAQGGIHTPNHRWVVCAALAQLHELYSHRQYVRRIDEWLAESIDIDEEGQYIERSTGIYNGHINHAFTVMAVKLERPELFVPVRTNLDAMRYLMHPNGEVVTEISRRQDVAQPRDMGAYWFALRYMALHDNNGQYAAMLADIEPDRVSLPTLMEYPEMLAPLPPPKPLPDAFERSYPLSEITRVRRGPLSMTLLGLHQENRLAAHFGTAVVQSVRLMADPARQRIFVPNEMDRRANGLRFRQSVSRSGITLHFEMLAMPKETGIDMQFRVFGEDKAPVAIEVGLRPGGELEGVAPAPRNNGYFLTGEYAHYRVNGNVLRIGPGVKEHEQMETLARGHDNNALHIYLTGHTPFEHTLSLEMT